MPIPYTFPNQWWMENLLEDIKVVTEPEKNLKLIIKGGKVYKNELGE
jgi:hypothetical protein